MLDFHEIQNEASNVDKLPGRSHGIGINDNFTPHMFSHLTPAERTVAIQRLTALWALNECGLGGILHAINSPTTGLLVGSFAMVCIAFICALAENKWKAVMTSLMIVLVIKALVSPHSTPTAFLAVTFQGVTGALIYRFIPHLLVSSVFFLVLGLLESAFQRLIVLTLLYGNTLWDAINIWGDVVTKRWGVIIPVSSSQLIISIYLAIHLVAGIVIGWSTYRAIKAVNALWGERRFHLTLGERDKKTWPGTGRRKKKKWKRVVVFILLIAVIVLAYSGIGDREEGLRTALIAILRATAILTFWFVFLAPWVIRALQNFLDKKHKQLSAEVAQTMDMFPHLLWILDKAWKETRGHGWLTRWKMFVIHTILYILQYRSQDDPDPQRTGT